MPNRGIHSPRHSRSHEDEPESDNPRIVEALSAGRAPLVTFQEVPRSLGHGSRILLPHGTAQEVGATRFRFVDTLGILDPTTCFQEIRFIHELDRTALISGIGEKLIERDFGTLKELGWIAE